MRPLLPLLLLALTTGCGRAQTTDPSAAHSADGLALAAVSARDPAATIALASPAIGPDGTIDARQSAYGANLSPALSWQPTPGAAAYAIVLEDPDARGPRPFVHWLIWNIPAASTSLAEGLATTAQPAATAEQGRNDTGGTGYAGPHPPAGTGVHRYHIQIFALDRRLDLKPGADRAALVGAMAGHVLADGDLVGGFSAPAQ